MPVISLYSVTGQMKMQLPVRMQHNKIRHQHTGIFDIIGIHAKTKMQCPLLHSKTPCTYDCTTGVFPALLRNCILRPD